MGLWPVQKETTLTRTYQICTFPWCLWADRSILAFLFGVPGSFFTAGLQKLLPSLKTAGWNQRSDAPFSYNILKKQLSPTNIVELWHYLQILETDSFFVNPWFCKTAHLTGHVWGSELEWLETVWWWNLVKMRTFGQSTADWTMLISQVLVREQHWIILDGPRIKQFWTLKWGENPNNKGLPKT